MLENKIVSQLKEIVGKDAVLTSEEDLAAYSFDSTTVLTHRPDVVVLPETTEQISQIMKLANENEIPVT